MPGNDDLLQYAISSGNPYRSTSLKGRTVVAVSLLALAGVTAVAYALGGLGTNKIHESLFINHHGDKPIWENGSTIKWYTDPDGVTDSVGKTGLIDKEHKMDNCTGVNPSCLRVFKAMFKVLEWNTDLHYEQVFNRDEANLVLREADFDVRERDDIAAWATRPRKTETGLIAADIVMNRHSNGYGRNESIVMHELLHSLGMDHREYEASIMNKGMPESLSYSVGLWPSDIEWLHHNYPPADMDKFKRPGSTGDIYSSDNPEHAPGRKQ